ncbi:hypothetical protein V474_22760 [Novosphingobium barchaimii LL02]|uniref:Uncharacterized protein n=1 Tax=Novosphingobium barchaimii LL02 TaxID=1114963 RepID=A0A0J8AFE3_9SPHN|nr:hypothetical protein [Novosphingobium barchaimii]KMS53605.1 hypothetical protein V474_22760 [Novosphingobium barchaimii LL02]
MADPLRFTTMPLSLVCRDDVGFTFQMWQPPLQGWTPVTDLLRASTLDQAGAVQRRYIAQHGGIMGLILDRPGWKRPDFGGNGRG